MVGGDRQNTYASMSRIGMKRRGILTHATLSLKVKGWSRVSFWLMCIPSKLELCECNPYLLS